MKLQNEMKLTPSNILLFHNNPFPLRPGFYLGKGFGNTDFKIVHLDRKIIFLQTFVRVHCIFRIVNFMKFTIK